MVNTFRTAVIALIGAAALLVGATWVVTGSADSAQALEPGTGLPLVPRTDTPRAIGGTITDQAQVGDLIVLVGTFEQVRDTDGTLLDQKYIVAYDIDSGAVDRSFNPVLNKEAISVEPDGTGGMIIGGKFSSVDGDPQNKLARLDGSGNRIASFRAEANAKVTQIAVRNNRVYIGGPFSAVKARGTWSDRSLLAAFMLADGSLDTAFDFPITGPAGRGGELSVKGLAFAGADLVISHSGTTVAGQSRVAAAIIDTTPVDSPSLRNWRTDFFKDNVVDAGEQLANTEMAVSPDGTYFVVVSSGGDRPLQGKDAAVRFPVAGGAGVEPDWISRHFDSMFAVGISNNAVFVGGHFQFQEAPGSPDPYPGDPNVNYGAGPAGQGAAQLGNQVVARQQIGALDPATGKSLNWNPGATAEIGVESLVVIDRGLLVGQDGDILGNKDIGRHGFFDIDRDVAPENGLTTSVTSHFDGETVDAGTVTVTGRATDDDDGVARVQLAIMHEPTGQWLQADGSLGPWVGLNANLAQAGGNDTTWQLDLRFVETGEYRIQAKTFTTDGRKDRSPAFVTLDARPAGDDRPVLDIDSAGIVGRTITVQGRVVDDRGVARVNVTLEDPATGEYLQANGSFGTAARAFRATLDAVDSPTTGWTIELTVPRNGRFRVEANPVDTAGQDDAKFEYRNIVVAENDESPTVGLDAEGIIESAPNGPFRIEVTAGDDTAIDRIRVRLRRQLTSEGTRPDNSYGENGTWYVIPGIDGQRNHTFDYVSPNLPVGNYTFDVQVTDVLGQNANIRRTIEVGRVGDAAPTGRINERLVYEAESTLSMTGTATDDNGVKRVDVYVRDLTNRRWVTAAGALVTTPSRHTASLDNAGAASTTWTWSLDAPGEARYRMYALPIDSRNQPARIAGTVTANHWYMPGDELPVIGLASPADGDTVSDRLFLTGRATDDTSVERLDVRIRREADRKWLRNDESWGGAQRLLATLTNPQRPGTNWDWASPDLAAGDYRVEIRVRDDTGRETLQVLVVTVT